jgi:hypothetical protein
MRETVLSETLTRQTLIVRRSHMRTNLSCVTVTAIAVLATLVLPYAVAAQSISLDGQSRKNVTLEFYNPQFKGYEWGGYYWREWGELSSVTFFLTSRFEVSKGLILTAELPYTRAHYSYGYSYHDSYWGDYENSEESSDAALGNPYLGVETRGKSSITFFEFGVRIPTLGEKDHGTGGLGWFADLDRLEAFTSECITIQSAGNLSLRSQEGLVGRARVGPYYWIYIGDCCGDRTELLLHYSAQVGYEPRSFAVLAGFSGVVVLTEDSFLEYDDISINQLGFQGNVSLGRFRPGVHFSIPLDNELREIYSSVWGLSLQYQFD